MLPLVSVPGSDDWWAMRLAEELGAGFPRLFLLDRYRIGDAPLPISANSLMRQGYADFVRTARLNFAPLIVDSAIGRRRILGFRTAAPGDQNGDPVASDIYTYNQGQVQFRDLLDDSGTYGRAFLTVTGQQAGAAPFSMPNIMRSNGWNTAIARNRVRPLVVDHAIQIGHDPELQVDVITYFRTAHDGQPGYFRQMYRQAKVSNIPSNGSAWYPGRDWTWAGNPIPFGFTDEVPIVEFATPKGIGEFELHIDTLDRVNRTILERLTITAMQAFRQRAIQPGKDAPAGSLPEFYPEDDPLGRAGQRINYDEVYEAGPAALWFLPLGSTVWESAVTDIRPIIEAVGADLKTLAAATATPLYVLSPEVANGSAEGAALSRESNLTKVLDRIDRDSSSAARVMQFAFQALRDSVRSDATKITTMWGSLELASTDSKALATYNAARGGLSKTFILENVWGATPDEIQQEEQNAIADGLAAAAAGTSPAAAS